MHNILPQRECVQTHVTSTCWEINDNISETMHDSKIVATEYRMWSIERHHCQCPWKSHLLTETFLTTMLRRA